MSPARPEGGLPGPERSMDKGAAVSMANKALVFLCVVSLSFIMGLTFCDVFMRYWFARPITGSAEMISFAIAIVVFSSFPLVTVTEQHITVSILHGRLGAKGAWIQRLVILLISLLCCATIGRQLLLSGHMLLQDKQYTMVLHLPQGYLSYFMGTLSCVAALAVLFLLVLHLGLCANPGARRSAT